MGKEEIVVVQNVRIQLAAPVVTFGSVEEALEVVGGGVVMVTQPERRNPRERQQEDADVGEPERRVDDARPHD